MRIRLRCGLGSGHWINDRNWVDDGSRFDNRSRNWFDDGSWFDDGNRFDNWSRNWFDNRNRNWLDDGNRFDDRNWLDYRYRLWLDDDDWLWLNDHSWLRFHNDYYYFFFLFWRLQTVKAILSDDLLTDTSFVVVADESAIFGGPVDCIALFRVLPALVEVNSLFICISVPFEDSMRLVAVEQLLR